MGNLGKKIMDNQDKQMLKDAWGKTPKHRCPNCHRFTLWHLDKKGNKLCHWCKNRR